MWPHFHSWVHFTPQLIYLRHFYETPLFKYFPRWGSRPLDEWLQAQWNKAPGWSLVLRTGTSGLRRRNLCEVSISFIYSPWWTPPLGVPDSRWGVPARSYRPHLETSGTLIFILALHEPNLLRPRCASTVCSGSFRALVSPRLHSSLENKLLVSHFLDPFKTTSQGRLIKTPQTAGRWCRVSAPKYSEERPYLDRSVGNFGGGSVDTLFCRKGETDFIPTGRDDFAP